MSWWKPTAEKKCAMEVSVALLMSMALRKSAASSPPSLSTVLVFGWKLGRNRRLG